MRLAKSMIAINLANVSGVSLLMSNGLHMKEGEFLRMRNDRSSSTVIEAGIKFMLFLTHSKNQQEKNSGKNVF